MGTCMKQENRVLWCTLDVRDEAAEVQTNGILVIVSVFLDLQPRIFVYGVVVGPGGVWDVNDLCMWVEPLKEGTTNTESTSPGYGLGDGNAVLLQWGRVGTIGEEGSCLGECGDTGDACILLVQISAQDALLCFPH